MTVVTLAPLAQRHLNIAAAASVMVGFLSIPNCSVATYIDAFLSSLNLEDLCLMQYVRLSAPASGPCSAEPSFDIAPVHIYHSAAHNLQILGHH